MNSNNEKKWFALEIVANTEASEAIEFGLNELEALGTEINNLGKLPTETLTIVGYFNEKISDEILQNQLNEALRIYNFDNSAIKNIEWREVENQDWLAKWKRSWKPTETDKFIIAPKWKRVRSKSGKFVVRIEPSMAFGTGTHETTRLCLKAIEQHYDADNMSFFDVGCGTGILAIAAEKMQSKKAKYIAVGCDTDEESVKIAEENAKLNRTNETIFFNGTIHEKVPNAHFICANLTADVIVPLLPLLTTKFDKVLVLSGILVEQKDWVLGELKKLGVKNSVVETDGEWISITVHKEL